MNYGICHQSSHCCLRLDDYDRFMENKGTSHDSCILPPLSEALFLWISVAREPEQKGAEALMFLGFLKGIDCFFDSMQHSCFKHW